MEADLPSAPQLVSAVGWGPFAAEVVVLKTSCTFWSPRLLESDSLDV
jgi:hypothetical protein